MTQLRKKRNENEAELTFDLTRKLWAVLVTDGWTLSQGILRQTYKPQPTIRHNTWFRFHSIALDNYSGHWAINK